MQRDNPGLQEDWVAWTGEGESGEGSLGGAAAGLQTSEVDGSEVGVQMGL